MSKENEKGNEVDPTEEDLEVSEEETTEEDSEEQEGDIESLKEDNKEKEKKIKELEALIVKNKKASKETPKDDDSPYLTKEEAFLLKELEVEDLEKLKQVQKGIGAKSLKEAKESDLFTSYIEKKKEERKSKEASLGASKGSGKGEDEFKPGMSDEEHKKAWKKRHGK